MSLNDLLKSKMHKHVTVPLDGDLVYLDGNGHCRGVEKRSGDPHTATQLGEERDEIARRHLRDAKTRPMEFTVEDEPEAPKAASTRASAERKKKLVAIAPLPQAVPVEAVPVEVEGAKTVTDGEAI